MKTPRTDAERRALKKAKSYPVDPVSADFARQLETELAAMTAMADRLAEALQRQRGFPYCPRAKVLSEEALAAYEIHKQKQHE